jgi:hypothetical protein
LFGTGSAMPANHLPRSAPALMTVTLDGPVLRAIDLSRTAIRAPCSRSGSPANAARCRLELMRAPRDRRFRHRAHDRKCCATDLQSRTVTTDARARNHLDDGRLHRAKRTAPNCRLLRWSTANVEIVSNCTRLSIGSVNMRLLSTIEEVSFEGIRSVLSCSGGWSSP